MRINITLLVAILLVISVTVGITSVLAGRENQR